MSVKEKFLKIGLPIIIILFGFLATAVMIGTKHEPARVPKKNPGALVEVFAVSRKDWPVTVQGTGTVQARQAISIVPQVNGEVVWLSPFMVEGGFFKKNEILFEIDDADYLLALEQAKAAQAKAELNLATIESWSQVARTEWERMDLNDKDSPNPLVVYEPQLKNARAELAASKAAVKQAELNLARTKVRAPFNCRVHSEDIDVGQYIRAGSSVAAVAGTDAAEVIVPLPLDELTWLHIPVKGSTGKGSAATISVDINGRDYERHGRITRSSGEVDAKSRMTRVVVGVEDPYSFSQKGNEKKQLIAGTFVDVSIRGGTLRGVFRIPRTALRDNATVWLMDEDNLLRIRQVNVVRYEREHVLIKNGLEDGNRIVLTKLSGAADGMKLRVGQQGNKQGTMQ